MYIKVSKTLDVLFSKKKTFSTLSFEQRQSINLFPFNLYDSTSVKFNW